MTLRRFELPAIIVVLSLVFTNAFAQQPNRVAAWLQTVQASHQAEVIQMLEPTELVSRALPVQDANFVAIDNDQLASLFENQPAVIRFTVPRGNDEDLTLTLARVNITTDDFSVGTKGDDAQENIYYKNGIHYRGIIDGDNQSVAALSFYNGEIAGFFSSANGNYTIGKVEGEDGVMAVYNSNQLPTLDGAGCYTADSGEPLSTPDDEGIDRGIGCKVVKVYFECDYALFVNKGSNTTNVVNYVTAFFNQVATLYANENIDIQISQVNVWSTTDPYASLNSTSTVLSSFRTTLGVNFNGNLAHFLTTRSLGGGIAYVDVICTKSYAFGVSMIYGTYSSVPTYSWTVECVTHELGHNLGSPHTQACSWVGGPIDNCYSVEGSCSPGPAPTNGGTIMSYCHLTSYGINFNNGFGTQPGDLIRSRVLNATCLAASGAVPTGLATSSIGTGSAVLAWVTVPNATQYTVQYKTAASSTWITAATTSAITYTLSGLASGTNYNWQVKTNCSSYSAAASFTTTSTTTSCAAPSALASSNITTSSASLSWGSVSGSTSYTVQYKVSSASTWGTLGTYSGTSTSLSGLASGTTYNWQVKASCSSGYSTVSAFTTAVPVSPGCTAPTGLTTSITSSTSATLGWNAVAGAASYSIKYKKSSKNAWTNVTGIIGTSKVLSGLQAGVSYDWKVKSSCNTTFSNVVTFVMPASSFAALQGTPTTNVQLYPNPARNEMHVVITGWNDDENGTLQLYNVTGALLRTQTVKAQDNAVTINDLPAGMYLVYVLKGANEPVVSHFVKQ